MGVQRALSFDGVDDHVVLPGNDGSGPRFAITVELCSLTCAIAMD